MPSWGLVVPGKADSMMAGDELFVEAWGAVRGHRIAEIDDPEVGRIKGLRVSNSENTRGGSAWARITRQLLRVMH